MHAVRIRKQLDSQVLDLPELTPFIGKAVEIIVLEDSEAQTTLPHRGPEPGSAKGLITMSPDFDEPLEDFEPYMR